MPGLSGLERSGCSSIEGGDRMSLEPRADLGVPELTARVVRASFPKGALAARIREAPGPLFEDASFAEAFPVRGRPAVSPGALALVSVLQYAEGLSDRQAAEQVRARMDRKFLLALELDDPGFDFTVLGDFRARLVGHGLEEKVLDVVLSRCSQLGLLRAGGRQRTDSTHVLASVRVAERVGQDGFTLLGAVFGPAAPGWLREVPAVQVLRRAWVEQYHRDGEGVRWREGKDLPPARRRLSSPYGHRRPLQRQARLGLGRVQDPSERDLRGGRPAPDHPRGHRRRHRRRQ
jgi:transposase